MNGLQILGIIFFSAGIACGLMWIAITNHED